MEFQRAVKVLKGLEFQSYGLEEALEDFVFDKLATLDRVVNEPFEWVLNDGTDVVWYISIRNVPIAYNEDGEAYEYRTELFFESELN